MDPCIYVHTRPLGCEKAGCPIKITYPYTPAIDEPSNIRKHVYVYIYVRIYAHILQKQESAKPAGPWVAPPTHM